MLLESQRNNQNCGNGGAGFNELKRGKAPQGNWGGLEQNGWQKEKRDMQKKITT